MTRGLAFNCDDAGDEAPVLDARFDVALGCAGRVATIGERRNGIGRRKARRKLD